jgi:hypothetical protein
MTAKTFAATARPVAIPVREALPWFIFVGLLLLLAIYFVGAVEGPHLSSRECMCTSSSMTPATFSGSPATSS